MGNKQYQREKIYIQENSVKKKNLTMAVIVRNARNAVLKLEEGQNEKINIGDSEIRKILIKQVKIYVEIEFCVELKKPRFRTPQRKRKNLNRGRKAKS